jgi:hypothetical protein
MCGWEMKLSCILQSLKSSSLIKKKKGNEQYNFNWFINSLTTILNDKSKCVTYGICKD